jgi:hypothetical protein
MEERLRYLWYLENVVPLAQSIGGQKELYAQMKSETEMLVNDATEGMVQDDRYPSAESVEARIAELENELQIAEANGTAEGDEAAPSDTDDSSIPADEGEDEEAGRESSEEDDAESSDAASDVQSQASEDSFYSARSEDNERYEVEMAANVAVVPYNRVTFPKKDKRMLRLKDEKGKTTVTFTTERGEHIHYFRAARKSAVPVAGLYRITQPVGRKNGKIVYDQVECLVTDVVTKTGELVDEMEHDDTLRAHKSVVCGSCRVIIRPTQTEKDYALLDYS